MLTETEGELPEGWKSTSFGGFVEFPLDENGALSRPGYVRLRARGRNNGGGACSSGGTFGSSLIPTAGGSTGQSPLPLFDGGGTPDRGAVVDVDTYRFALHRRGSPYGNGWGIESALELYQSPDGSQSSVVNGTGDSETFLPRPELTELNSDVGFGFVAMTRDAATGDILLANSDGVIGQLGPTGAVTPLLSGLPFTGLNSPKGLAVDYVGAVRHYFVATRDSILEIDGGGAVTTLSAWTDTTNADAFNHPHVAAGQGALYFSDAESTVVQRVRLDDPTRQVEPITAVSGSVRFQPEVPAGQVQLFSPRGLAVASDGSLFVADTSRGVIMKLNAAPDGLAGPMSTVERVAGSGRAMLVARYGEPAAKEFALTQPIWLSMAPDGSVAIQTAYGLAVYDDVAKTARWLALDNESGDQRDFKFILWRSGTPVAIDRNTVVVGAASGRTAIARIAVNGLTSQYNPTRRITTTASGATLVDTMSGNVDTFTWADPSNLFGRATERRRRTGELIHRMAYLSDGRLDYIEDPLGGRWAFSYDANSKLSQISDPSGRTTTFSVDGSGDLRSLTKPSTETHSFSYQFHRMTRAEGPRGTGATYTYATNGLLESTTRDEGGSYQFDSPLGNQPTYDVNGDLEFSGTWTDDRGVVHTFTVGETGDNPRETFTADGVTYVKETTYVTELSGDTFIKNRDNRLGRIAFTTVNGVVNGAIYEYDDKGRVVRQRTPAGAGTLFGERTNFELRYNADDFVEELRPNATSVVWRIERDANNRISRIYDQVGGAPTGRESTFTWRSDGQPATATQHGVTTTLTYRASDGNLDSTVDALSRSTSFTYDSAGNVTSASDGTTTNQFVFDANNRLTTITDGAGQVTTMGYQQPGCGCSDANLVTSVVTPDLAPLGKQWSMAYDLDGRLTSVTDPEGRTESYTFTPAGELSSLTDRLTRTTAFGLDELGRPITSTDTGSRPSGWSYPIPASGNWTGPSLFAGSPLGVPAETDINAPLASGQYQVGLNAHRAGGYPAQIELYRDATFELSFGRLFDDYERLLQRQDRTRLPVASPQPLTDPGLGPDPIADSTFTYDNKSPLALLASYNTNAPGGAGSATFSRNAEFDVFQADGWRGPGLPSVREDIIRDVDGRPTRVDRQFTDGGVVNFNAAATTIDYSTINGRQVARVENASGIQDFTYNSRGLVDTLTLSFTPAGRSAHYGGPVCLRI